MPTETEKPAAASDAPRDVIIGTQFIAAEAFPTLTLGDDIPRDKFPSERNGKKCFYWDKEAIGPGVIRTANGDIHKLDPKDVDEIISEVRGAMSFGHEPAIPDRHFFRRDEKYRNLGWVKAIAKNKSGNIVLTHQHVGEEENNDALNNKTSVMLRRNYTDERGRFWKWWLDHNASLPNPQLRDLADFTPSALAASSGQTSDAEPYLILADTNGASTPESPTMDWTKFRAALADKAKDVPDDKMEALVLSTLTETTDKNIALSSDLEKTVAALKDQTANAELFSKELEAKEAQIVKLSADDDEPKLDPRVRGMFVESVEGARELVLDSGWTPAQLKPIDDIFNDANGKPTDLALSADGVSDRPLAYRIYKALKSVGDGFIKTQNTVDRSKTKPVQSMALSGDTEKPPTDEELKKARSDWNL